ncbi:hypothetical protein HPG69_015016, partial [Diceros bicornis minor]
MRNHTMVTTFIFLGLTDDPNWQMVIFLFLFLIHRHTADYIGTGNAFLCKYHKNDSEDPFCPTEKEGFFYLFLPHDCCLYLLWQLNKQVKQALRDTVKKMHLYYLKRVA